MDLKQFRQVVDGAAPGIASCEGDLQRLYDYVGLEQGFNYTVSAVSDALYARIKGCFASGHAAVWRKCKSLRTDLIRDHVLSGAALDPYFEVLDHLLDAIRVAGDPGAPIEGDWEQAIQSAFDYVQTHGWGVIGRERVHARDFMVAEAARVLRDAGFAIRLEPGRLRLEEAAETALIAAIEDLVATMGGLNVARRIFETISPDYDVEQQRYHLVRRTSSTGGGEPQMPWGYLIQLAAKHARGRKPYVNTDDQWRRLCGLSQVFAAIIDVQPYTPTFYGTMDATALMPYLQEMAVYDTLFRIPQMRPTDVVKVARGMLDWFDMSAPTKAGWSVNQALEVIGYLLRPVRDVRGPVPIDEADIRRACPQIPRDIVTKILDDVLSHPPVGANLNFSRPTDAPVPENPDLKDVGQDFFRRPLLHQSGRRFVLLDRSVCAPACLEALLTPLRQETKNLDDKVGSAVERFLNAEFALHGVPTCGGDYDVGGEHGECDLVIEVPKTVIFCEVKKKTLTRRAKAGSDAHLLLDLAGSLLPAQAQAGWHEVRLRRHGHLDLKRCGITTRLELNEREIERVAVSLFDFGSFQDRILLKQFLEATMNAKFTPVDASLNKKFDDINEALIEIREQVTALHVGQKEVNQPFFHCWYLSVPQLLVLLDGVTDGASFKTALWSCRHIVTGTSDFYFEISMMKRWKRESAAKTG
jgi:hypothetical protein